MGMLYFLVSVPPHAVTGDLSAVACALSTTVAEANLQIRYPAPVIWRKAESHVVLDTIQAELNLYGVHSTIVSEEELFSVPEPEVTSTCTIDSSAITLTNSNKKITFDLSKPLLFTEQQHRSFGAEYRRYKEKDLARRDKTKRKELNLSHALMSERALSDTEKKFSYTWFFSQQTSEGLLRASVKPAQIEFSFLNDRMALNVIENSKICAEIITRNRPHITHRQGLVGIPARYPQFLNPSFIQLLEARGVVKEDFPPEVLLERLTFCVWQRSQSALLI